MEKRELILRGMDSMLVKINEIKDIEEISFSDLAPSSYGDKMTVMPNLYVMYDGGKYMSLCSKDKYFDEFVRKVFQVYNQEKGMLVSDPRFDPFGKRKEIKIDERTKTILESGDLTKINEIYEFYAGKKSYDRSLLFESDVLKQLLPIVKYHLKLAFDCTDKTVTFADNVVNGFRTNYGMEYKIDGTVDMLLINFISFDGNTANLKIRSREKNFKPLEMSISFNNNDITVNTHFSDYGLFINNSFEVKKNNTIVNIFRVTKNGEIAIYKTRELEKCENPLPNISSIDSDDDMVWYQLPWNALYGVNNQVQELSEVDEIVIGHNKYLAIINDEFMLREYASKEYRRKKTFEAHANLVVMDQVSKRVFGILVDPKEGVYVIETYFGGIMRTNGYYDSYLEDKYFYHTAQSKKKLKGLKRDGLVTLSQEDEIIKGADLLVASKLKKKLARR
jgi:hypothetical protein